MDKMFTRLKQLKETAHEYNKAPIKPSAGFMPEGHVDTHKWWKQRNLRTLNLFLLIPLLSIFSQGFDGSMMNGLQSVTQWQKYFGRPTGATLGLFNAAYPMGGIVGVFFISPVSDTYGRRAGIATGAAVSILGAVLQASASHISTFVVARFVLGIGCVITAGVGSPFVTEIAHPKQRTTATGLFLTFYSLGAIVAAWCTFGTFRVNNSAAWRIPSALQGFPSLIQLALIWWVPESPRWLASKGRHGEAWSIICHYHAEDNPHDPLALFEFTSIKVALSSQPTHKTIIASWFEFLSTSSNRRRTVILIWAALVSQLSGNAFVSYYLSPILTSIGLTSDLQQTLINATSQLLSWFSAVYFATLIPKLGRRTMFLWSLVAIWICDIVITIGSASFSSSSAGKPNKAAAYTVVVFLYLFSPAYNFGWNGNLGLYIPEILPYHLRTKGLALFYFFQFSFGILSAFATPVGLKNMGWKFYCIFVGWVVVEFLGVWWGFVETKGPGLEDLWFVFDEGRGMAGGVVRSSDGVKQFVKVGEGVVEEVAKRAEAEASGKAIVNQESVG